MHLKKNGAVSQTGIIDRRNQHIEEDHQKTARQQFMEVVGIS